MDNIFAAYSFLAFELEYTGFETYLKNAQKFYIRISWNTGLDLKVVSSKFNSNMSEHSIQICLNFSLKFTGIVPQKDFYVWLELFL